MKTLHLFAGAGGGLYADLILGHQPIGAVEHDAYCCSVLSERAAEGWFPGLRVHECDVRDFLPSEYAGRVDCLSAGFPCQDISVAGSGRGIDGERSGLWAEVVRCAGVIRPRYLFLENSPAILVRGLGRVVGDLARMGYDARWCVLSAATVGAPHLRARWWCVATDTDRLRQLQPQGRERDQWGWTGDGGQTNDRHANGSRLAQRESQPGDDGQEQSAAVRADWWESEPAVDRVAHGVADRVHRLKALGNGQVPLQAAAAWCILTGGSPPAR